MMDQNRNAQTNPALDHVAALLQEQIEECHYAAIGVFRHARQGLDGSDAQLDAMKSATRLMQAAASAASALKRLYGSESRHTVTVAGKAGGGIPIPEKSKTNVPDAEGGYPTLKFQKRMFPVPRRRSGRKPGGQLGNRNALKSGCHTAPMIALRKDTRWKLQKINAAIAMARLSLMPGGAEISQQTKLVIPEAAKRLSGTHRAAC